MLLFKCRTDTLNLNNGKRFAGGDTSCEICAEENENLEHFLLWCPEYQRERNVNTKLQRPFKEDVEKVIGELLFQENIEEAKETIYNMWKKREKKLKESNDWKRPDQPQEANIREVPLKRQHLPTLTRTRTRTRTVSFFFQLRNYNS